MHEIARAANYGVDPPAALVVEEGDAVVGFLSLGPPIHEMPFAEPVLELHASFVKRLAGGRIGVLDVWEGNARAVGFYERRGWCRDGRSRPAHHGTAYVGMSLRH